MKLCPCGNTPEVSGDLCAECIAEHFTLAKRMSQCVECGELTNRRFTAGEGMVYYMCDRHDEW